jgi:glycosyltransferase involved in cell wall biosynthesis
VSFALRESVASRTRSDWRSAQPILCNQRSEVLVDHCLRSNGGLFYGDRDEFVEWLKVLMADERLASLMGRSGRDYVRRNYRWDVVLGKLDRMIARVRSA